MTRGELKTLVSVWLDDLNFGYFTEAQINIWLNNAQMELQKLLIGAGVNWYAKEQQTTTVPNQADYVLPDDFLKSHRVEYVQSGTYPNEDIDRLGAIAINQQDRIPLKVGSPVGFYLKKDKMILVPVPDAAKTLKLMYSYRVSPMTSDSDVPDAPEQYHEFLAVLAAEDGFLRDREIPDWLTRKREKYEEMIKSDSNERTQDDGRDIVVTEDYGDGYVY